MERVVDTNAIVAKVEDMRVNSLKINKQVLETLKGHKMSIENITTELVNLESTHKGGTDLMDDLDFTGLHARAPSMVDAAKNVTKDMDNVNMLARCLETLEMLFADLGKGVDSEGLDSGAFGGNRFSSFDSFSDWVDENLLSDDSPIPFGAFCNTYCAYQHIFESIIGRSYDAREL
mmetsp:Transcript_785/g.1180  ORF Transcript_785/g.1180 Transcript_785/m.1180 type:complete len:176 (+) Transcript_785:1280-1807(+)